MVPNNLQKNQGHAWADIVCRLKLTNPSENHVFDREDFAFAHEIELLKDWSTLVLSFCSNRAWSQAHFGLVLPYCLVRILASDDERVILPGNFGARNCSRLGYL